MASVFRLYVQFWPLHGITRFRPKVMDGPPDTSRHPLLETLNKDTGHVATASLSTFRNIQIRANVFFDPDIAIEFCDEDMKLVFHTDALFLLPLEKQLGFRSVMDTARYDCTSIDAVAGHDHYRIHVIFSLTKWEAENHIPLKKQIVGGDKLKDDWAILMVGVTDNNGWRENIGQTVYFGDTKALRIRVRDPDWVRQWLVWCPLKEATESRLLLERQTMAHKKSI